MKKYSLFLLAGLCFSQNVYSKEISYEKLYQLGLSSNFELKAKIDEYERTVQAKKAYSWSLTPELELRSTKSISDFSLIDQTNSTSLVLTNNLFDGFKDQKRYEQLNLKEQKDLDSINLDRLNIEKSIGLGYINWHKAFKRSRYYDEIRRYTEKFNQQIIKAVRRGERKLDDQLIYENQLLEIKNRIYNANIDLMDAKVEMENILGASKLPENTVPSSEIFIKNEFCSIKVSKEYFKDHISLSDLVYSIKNIQIGLDQNKWEYGPKVDLSYLKSIDFLSSDGFKDRNILSLSLSVPIWNGLKPYYENIDLKIQNSIAQTNMQKKWLELDRRHNFNCKKLSTLETRILNLEKILKNYDTILKRSKYSVEIGELSITDYITQQINQLNSGLNLLEARHEKWRVALDQSWLHKGKKAYLIKE